MFYVARTVDLDLRDFRFYCRHFIIHRVGPDDWIMLFALVYFFGSLGFVCPLLMWVEGEYMGYKLALELYATACIFSSKLPQAL